MPVPAPAGYTRRKLGDIFFDTFFQYAIPFTFTTGSETLTGTIPIQSDAHFLCVHSMYDTGVPVATEATRITLLNGGALVTLTDGGNQSMLSNIPVPADSMFGTAQRPYMWPFVHLFRANTPITFQLVGQGAGSAGLTMRFVLGGFKVPLNSGAALGLPL